MVMQKMTKKFRTSLIISIAAILMVLLLITACGSFQAGVPDGFVGEWQCEDLAWMAK